MSQKVSSQISSADCDLVLAGEAEADAAAHSLVDVVVHARVGVAEDGRVHSPCAGRRTRCRRGPRRGRPGPGRRRSVSSPQARKLELVPPGIDRSARWYVASWRSRVGAAGPDGRWRKRCRRLGGRVRCRGAGPAGCWEGTRGTRLYGHDASLRNPQAIGLMVTDPHAWKPRVLREPYRCRPIATDTVRQHGWVVRNRSVHDRLGAVHRRAGLTRPDRSGHPARPGRGRRGCAGRAAR